VPPGGDVMPCRIEERAEPHLTFRAHSLRHFAAPGCVPVDLPRL
jgi:hypothetical protein